MVRCSSQILVNVQVFHELVNTLMFGRYRAPECLLTDGYYDYKMDVWSVGCVYFEISTLDLSLNAILNNL